MNLTQQQCSVWLSGGVRVGEQDELKGLSRGKRIAVALSGLMVFVIFLGSFAAFLLEPGGTFYLRHAGSQSRIPLTREQGLAFWVPLLALCTTAVIFTFWHGLRLTWKTAKPATIAPEISPAETVLWFGRSGWRSFRGGRLAVTLLAVVAPMLLLRWMWSIAAGDDIFVVKLFWLMLPAFLLFGSVVPALVSGSGTINSWICDVFGSIAITRARIVWLTPIKRRIYRTISAADIVDVFISESAGRRGSVTVIRRVRTNIENVDLVGLLEPERAHAAVQSLITYRSPSGAQL